MDKTQKTLGQLFFPIWLETLCSMFTGIADTLMLATEGDHAVGAVGTCNTYINMFIMMFTILSSGMVAVMTQYIGAGNSGVAAQARRIGILFNSTIGIILSLLLFLAPGEILNLMGIASMLLAPGKTYLRVIGAFLLCNALTPIFSSYLRAFGHTRESLWATLAANAVNIILNAVFLFVCHWGVLGVALATGISRLVNLLVVIFFALRIKPEKKAGKLVPNLTLFRQIIQIGLPSAVETILYNIAMSMTVRFLNQMDPYGMQVTARSYALQITNFSYSVGCGLAQANAILTGWRIGAGEYEACDRGTRKAVSIAIMAGIGIETIFYFTSGWFMPLFTSDPQMIALVRTLLLVDIVLEIGRASNLVFCTALKTSGDAIFPMIMGIIFMFLCMVGGTWFFGVRLGWLAVGAFAGMALDELARALCMMLRWRSGKWKSFSLAKKSA